MNAAKSKSCVITSKECAKTLIGFYVDPRPRVPNSRAPSAESDADMDEQPEHVPSPPAEKPTPRKRKRTASRSPTPPAGPSSSSPAPPHDDAEEMGECILCHNGQDIVAAPWAAASAASAEAEYCIREMRINRGTRLLFLAVTEQCRCAAILCCMHVNVLWPSSM